MMRVKTGRVIRRDSVPESAVALREGGALSEAVAKDGSALSEGLVFAFTELFCNPSLKINTRNQNFNCFNYTDSAGPSDAAFAAMAELAALSTQNPKQERYGGQVWVGVNIEPGTLSFEQLVRCGGQGATGFVQFLHRWYDAQTGKWLSRDPIGVEGGINLYAYTENNPVNAIDPLGLGRDEGCLPGLDECLEEVQIKYGIGTVAIAGGVGGCSAVCFFGCKGIPTCYLPCISQCFDKGTNRVLKNPVFFTKVLFSTDCFSPVFVS